MIRVAHVSHTYPGSMTPSVRDISFTIETGEIFGFLGPSGAGKSTVQNLLTGLLPLREGDIFYDDMSVREIKPSFFNRIGVSFEHPNLYLKLTGYENLAYYAGLFDRKTVDPMILLRSVGLEEHADKRAAAYSKGMKQRLVFCRALLNDPEILFLDEPTSGLDPSTAEVVKGIIREKRSRGCTIFLTTHNMLTADQLCDRVAFINEGTIAAIGTPKSLKLRYGEASVVVEIEENGELISRSFSLAEPGEKASFLSTVEKERVRTIHTREATLEEIFIRLTGRKLS